MMINSAFADVMCQKSNQCQKKKKSNTDNETAIFPANLTLLLDFRVSCQSCTKNNLFRANRSKVYDWVSDVQDWFSIQSEESDLSIAEQGQDMPDSISHWRVHSEL